MDLITLTMHVIAESDCNVPVLDGSGILLPVPGLERGMKVSKTFACLMSLRTPMISEPISRYSVDLENRTLLSADWVDVFSNHAPVCMDWSTPEMQSRLSQYSEAYPRFYASVFQNQPDQETLAFCRETVLALEAAMGKLIEYYHWLSPELFEWLKYGENRIESD